MNATSRSMNPRSKPAKTTVPTTMIASIAHWTSRANSHLPPAWYDRVIHPSMPWIASSVLVKRRMICRHHTSARRWATLWFTAP